MRKRTAIALGVTLLTAGLPSPGLLETAASSGIRQVLNIIPLRDLGFGDVLPGVDKAVARNDPASGKWEIQGIPFSNITITFPTLPAALSNGPSNIPIVFGSTDASHDPSNNPDLAVPFDPAVGTTTSIGALGRLYVWLGGTVQPSDTAPEGTYTGTITLEVEYAK